MDARDGRVMPLSELQLRNYSDRELVCYLVDSDNAETKALALRLECALDEAESATEGLIDVDDYECPDCDVRDEVTNRLQKLEDLVLKYKELHPLDPGREQIHQQILEWEIVE